MTDNYRTALALFAAAVSIAFIVAIITTYDSVDTRRADAIYPAQSD